MSERCYFAARPPKVEVRGDLIFIIPDGCPCEIALSAATLTAFIGAAHRALGQFHAASVVEFPARH